MYTTFPSAPPWSLGSWATTASVWASCVFPQRYSPNTSLMLPDWKPPSKIESHCLLPVEMRKQRLRTCRSSAPVRKPPALGCAHSQYRQNAEGRHEDGIPCTSGPPPLPSRP